MDNRGIDGNAGIVSEGGFVFGAQGWNWGEPRVKSITFFLDGSAMVCDQWGRPIKGDVDTVTNKEVKFATTPPLPFADNKPVPRPMLATHAQVVASLDALRVDWQGLTLAGFPQLPYEALKKLRVVPPTAEAELRLIRDAAMRRDALRYRREVDEVRAAEAAEEAVE